MSTRKRVSHWDVPD
jgi:hypothetical protein